jgi:hypothetical protein
VPLIRLMITPKEDEDEQEKIKQKHKTKGGKKKHY